MQYKSALSEENMPKSTNNGKENGKKEKSEKAITVYSQTFLDELTERGVLDQQLKAERFEFDKPSNYDAIRSAIMKNRPWDVPSKEDFEEFTDSLMDASISNETAQGKLYQLFFGTSKVLRAPHLEQHNDKWNKHEPIIGEVDAKDCKQVPWPDLAEGLKRVEVPRWICKRLRGYSVPRARLAFPNFVVELKRDRSMYTAHAQNRHCGAVASQAFVEYYAQFPDDSESPWNIARVGSIEFNGDVVVGNIHWASSSDKTGQDRTVRKYHMTRVMCRFTYGLGYEDFVVARKEARNFREYFLDKRKEFLQKCKKLPQTPIGGAVSVSEEVDRLSDDDSTESDQQEAPQPQPPTAGQATRKRGRNEKDQNQVPGKGRGRPPKRPRSGNGDNSVEEDEHTGLTQDTQACGLVIM